MLVGCFEAGTLYAYGFTPCEVVSVFEHNGRDNEPTRDRIHMPNPGTNTHELSGSRQSAVVLKNKSVR